MNGSVLPPAVAGVVATVIAVTRRLPTILLQSSGTAPTPRSLSTYIIGGRTASFVLVYGLVLGVGFAVGRSRDGREGDGTVVLATGLIAALAYVVATAAILLVLEPRQDPIMGVLTTVGSGVGVGTQLAVVTFAGMALADRGR